MIIIADSGSTKCDWALIDEKGTRVGDFQTMGLNPYFHSPDVIEKAIKDNAPFYALADQIKHIFFYGAGSSTTEMHAIIRAGLERVFKHAEILVEHDQLGSPWPCMTESLALLASSAQEAILVTSTDKTFRKKCHRLPTS